jgi:hypothetical protein
MAAFTYIFSAGNSTDYSAGDSLDMNMASNKKISFPYP